MIFVTLGSAYGFDRLAIEVDSLVRNKKIRDLVFIQIGYSKYEPVHCKWKRFLSYEEMCKKIEMAELVIAHAGAGTTLLCIQLGKHPILVPRRKQFKEVVDDHQLEFAARMEKLGYATVALDISDLGNFDRIKLNTEILSNWSKSNLNKLKKYLTYILLSWDK